MGTRSIVEIEKWDCVRLCDDTATVGICETNVVRFHDRPNANVRNNERIAKKRIAKFVFCASTVFGGGRSVLFDESCYAMGIVAKERSKVFWFVTFLRTPISQFQSCCF